MWYVYVLKSLANKSWYIGNPPPRAQLSEDNVII
jgi:hypothetical protein